MKLRFFLTIVGLTIVLGGIFGYKWFVAYKTAEFFANQEAPTETVTAATAEPATWQPVIEAVGSLEAVQGVDITAEITGKIIDIAVHDGAEVAEGQIVASLDADSLKAELRGARAEASLARIQRDRQRQLREKNAVSQSDFDQASSRLEQALAQVANIEAELAKKTIKAPFAGRLGIIEVDVGQYINPGDPIVTLQTLDPISVDFTVPQQELARIDVGLPIVVRADAFGAQPFRGRITAISPKVNTQTRNVAVRGRIGNADGLLRPGMFVDVAVELPKQENVITLPQAAITYNPYGDSVFLINESTSSDGSTELTVERKFVTTGATRGDQVQIIDGVAEGQRVVTSGQIKLRNGSRVTIAEGPQPGNDPSPDVGNQ
ncbi:MAG TPA: efflux RND transporter periplasmic adaptor subunit [Arenicellales bacterium]|nr:efflux RND transporter periplasmic adaptor subunit [Arenicellales bacterium]